MTITTAAAHECPASTAQGRQFDMFPAREFTPGSFTVMRALSIREKRERVTVAVKRQRDPRRARSCLSLVLDAASSITTSLRQGNSVKRGRPMIDQLIQTKTSSESRCVVSYTRGSS